MTVALDADLQNRESPLPLHVRIREDLREHIVRQHWLPQCRIPSEAELVRHYGVSRITVRQALHALSESGLIVKVAGRGSFVVGPKPCQQLTRLKGLAEALSPQGYALHNRILELSRVAAPPDAARALQLPVGTIVTFIRRVRLADGVPVCCDRSWLPQTLGDRVAMSDLERRDIFAVLESDGATPLCHAEMSLTAVPAPPAIADKLGIPAGTAVMYGERVTHDRHAHPVDYEQLYWRGDNFQFRLHIERDAARASPALCAWRDESAGAAQDGGSASR